MRQCEEARQALSAANLATSIDDDLAMAITHFERHCLPALRELLLACQRVARWTGELATL